MSETNTKTGGLGAGRCVLCVVRRYSVWGDRMELGLSETRLRAIALLADENLVWSSDLENIRVELMAVLLDKNVPIADVIAMKLVADA